MKAILIAALIGLVLLGASASPTQPEPFLEITVRPGVAVSTVTTAISRAAGIQKLPPGLTLKDMLDLDAWLPHKDAKTQKWVPGYLTGDKLKARMNLLCLWDLPAPEKWLWLKARSPLPLPALDFAKISNATISSVVMAPLSLGTGLMVAASHGPQDLKNLADAIPGVLALPLQLSAMHKGLPVWLIKTLQAMQAEAGSVQTTGQALLKELFTNGGSASSLLARRRLLDDSTSTQPSRGPIATLISTLSDGAVDLPQLPAAKSQLPQPLQTMLAPLASLNIEAFDPVKMMATLMQEFVGLVQKQATAAGTAQLKKLQTVGEKLTAASLNILNAAHVDILQGNNKNIDVLAGLAAVPQQLPLLIEALTTLLLPPGALTHLQGIQNLDLIKKLPAADEIERLVQGMVKGALSG